jgi:hypothetical protein
VYRRFLFVLVIASQATLFAQHGIECFSKYVFPNFDFSVDRDSFPKDPVEIEATAEYSSGVLKKVNVEGGKFGRFGEIVHGSFYRAEVAPSCANARIQLHFSVRLGKKPEEYGPTLISRGSRHFEVLATLGKMFNVHMKASYFERLDATSKRKPPAKGK